MSRYNGREKAINSNEMYENTFDERGVNEIEQYRTPKLKFPNEQGFKQIRTIDYTWKQGDKFWKIAGRQYGDSTLWWVIAQFNRKPTEGHLSPGDVIKIPIDLSDALGAML
jgi:nucleoid-associated protein YgaU